MHKKKGAKNKKPSRNSAHITAPASCGCKATHIRKVGNSNIVQAPGEATATGCTPQKTGNRAAVVLHRPPGGETEQRRGQTHQSFRNPYRKRNMKKMRQMRNIYRSSLVLRKTEKSFIFTLKSNLVTSGSSSIFMETVFPITNQHTRHRHNFIMLSLKRMYEGR